MTRGHKFSLSYAAVLFTWAYALVVVLWIVAGWGGARVIALVIAWHPLLLQIVTLILLAGLLRTSRTSARRRAWYFVFAAVFSDLLANASWSYVQASANDSYNIWELLYYPLMVGACAEFYRDVGGSFAERQVWLDASLLGLGLGATLWLFVLRPNIGDAGIHYPHLLYVAVCAVGDCILMIIAVLLAMRINSVRAERSLVLLLGAVTLEFVTDLGWIGANSREVYTTGAWDNAVGYGCYYACLATAVVSERRRPNAVPTANRAREARNGFLPILAVLFGIALLLGEKAHLHGAEGATLISFVAICAVAVAMRQRGVGHEIYRLNQTLDVQMAEAHASDFLQRSADLLVIVKDRQRYSFVSSASQTVLNVSPGALLRQSVTTLLGPANTERIRRFLEGIATEHSVNAEMEAVIVGRSGEQQVLHIVGSDQSLNPAIAGIVLTVRDVTEQRQLEREALEIAAREQERVSYDLHEGLSQDLTGIALLLKSLNLASIREARLLVGVLDTTIEHVNQAIDSTRRMATTLSPVHLSHGSLDLALDRLAQGTRENYSVRVVVSTLYDERAVGESQATQLYRIAQDGIDYVGRNTGCSTVEVSLSTHGGELVLAILGNGESVPPQAVSERSAGLRMGRFRARALGGTLRAESRPTDGIRLVVTVPCAEWPALA